VLNVEWVSKPREEGTVCVSVSEHLFGWDLVFSVVTRGTPAPIAILTSSRQPTATEKVIAISAANWRDAQRYDIFAARLQQLNLSLMD
jgi:hypothetical protein